MTTGAAGPRPKEDAERVAISIWCIDSAGWRGARDLQRACAIPRKNQNFIRRLTCGECWLHLDVTIPLRRRRRKIVARAMSGRALGPEEHRRSPMNAPASTPTSISLSSVSIMAEELLDKIRDYVEGQIVSGIFPKPRLFLTRRVGL